MQRPMQFESCSLYSVLCWSHYILHFHHVGNVVSLIHQAGIIRVVYSKAYKDDSGLIFLKKAGVMLNELELNNSRVNEKLIA